MNQSTKSDAQQDHSIIKILVAEDDPVTLMTLEYHLNSCGFHVYTATDGREALALMERMEPDLILTDIMMPFTSGLELIGMVRSTPSLHIPIIVLSAIDEETTVIQAFSLGADDFITKPFAPNELSIRVKRLLNAYHKKCNRAKVA